MDDRPIVGMVGAGQLARMCWQAAIGLDVRLRVLATDRSEAAARVMPDADVDLGGADDANALHRFAERCDVLTFDHELVDDVTLRALVDRGRTVRPGPGALRYAQDKAAARTEFAAAGIPVPAFVVTADIEVAEAFADQHGWPVVCKRPRGGYDGRGVEPAADRAQLAAVWRDFGSAGAEVLVEQSVAIEREIAVVSARRPGGQRVMAPVVETVQRNGMLRELVVPAPVPADVARAAEQLAGRIVDFTDVTGVCAVELFWTGDELLVNEIATRPHNSGHWTIDGAVTSQFANHLRAVLDLPLGAMDATAPAVCSVNVVGAADDDWPQARLGQALDVPGVAIHLYGKSPRAGRKLGHITAAAADADTARRHAHGATARLTPPHD